MLAVIAAKVPFKPNLVRLSEKIGIHRNSIGNYFHYLEEARLISLLYPSGFSVATLQKPGKVFLNNTNLMYAHAENETQIGSIRETFVLNRLRTLHNVCQPKSADFEVDGKIIFGLGGSGKGTRQIHGLKNAFIIKDAIEYPVANAIPLWMIRMLY
jgi:uncharacterized protein